MAVSISRSTKSWLGRLLAALALLALATPVVARSPESRLNPESTVTPTSAAGLRPAALLQAEVGLITAQSQFENIKARIGALRSMGRGSNQGLAINAAAGGPVTMLLASSSLAQSDEAEGSGLGGSGWGFFAAASFGNGDTDAGLVSPGSDFDTASLTAGFDYRYSDRWVLGFAAGATRHDTDLNLGQGRLDNDGWNVSVYSTYSNASDWYFDNVLSYGRNSYDMLRPVVGDTLVGSSDGSTLSFASSFGKEFRRGAWGIGPYGRLQYSRQEFDSFVETARNGTVAPRLISTGDFSSFSAVFGGQLTYTHSTDWGVVIPHFQAEWQHEFQDDPATVETSFVGVPGAPLVSIGDPADSNFFRLGFGMSFVFSEGRSGFFYYERLLGNDRMSQGNLALGFRLEF